MRLTKEGPLQTTLANGNESREIICCDRIFFFFFCWANVSDVPISESRRLLVARTSGTQTLFPPTLSLSVAVATVSALPVAHGVDHARLHSCG